jgi:hypothetical protein
MAHPQETRVALRAAYLGGLGLELAAVKAGISIATARRWKDEAQEAGDDWDKFKAASLMVAGGGLEQAMRRVAAGVVLRAEATLELLQDNTEMPPLEVAKALGGLVESLSKAQDAMKRLMPEADALAIETSAVKQFADLMLKKHPAVGEAVLSALEAWANGER